MNDKKIKYSVIIPTLNEENFINSILADLEAQIKDLPYSAEVIISDGSSLDKTLEICKRYNVTVINSEFGRGKQLRTGVDYSNGETLILLHVDVKIPKDLFGYLDNNFVDDVRVATFRMRLDVKNLLYKLYSFFTRFDSVFTTFGDQGLIVNRSFYFSIGGIKDLPLMEDVDFFRRVRKIAKIKKFNKNLIVSTRRFDKLGIIKTQLKSFICIIKFLVGEEPNKIYQYYYSIKDEKKKSSNSFSKISSKRKSKDQISFNNK